MKKYIFILAAALTAGANLLHAQSTEHKGLLWSSLHGLDYEFKAGVNIGGTSPLPLPKEIRSLDSYSPGLAITIEGNATKWVDAAQKWGISLGVRLDSKDMTTRATVKNYGMAIFNEVGGKVPPARAGRDGFRGVETLQGDDKMNVTLIGMGSGLQN